MIKATVRNWRMGTVALALAASTLTIPAGAALAVNPPPKASPFKDLPATSWAYTDVAWLMAQHVIDGNGDGTFQPDDPVTRAAFSKMLVTALGIHPTVATVHFDDVPADAWYAAYVSTAYRLGLVDGVGMSGFDPNTIVTRQLASSMLVRAFAQRRKELDQTGGASLAAYADRGQIAPAFVPGVQLAVGDGLLRGVDATHLAPTAPVTRAQAAVMVARLMRGLAAATNAVKVDGQTFMAAKSWTMTATAYSSNEPGVGTLTYTGLRVRPGIVAVDPNVIPLGSLLYVEGYGFAIAADIGTAIKGNRIDLYMAESAQTVNAFGYQSRQVYLLELPH